MTSALSRASDDFATAHDSSGLCPPSPKVTVKTIGVYQGRFYEYGDTPRTRTFFPAETPGIWVAVRDVRVTQHGKAGFKTQRDGSQQNWDGDRDHLNILLQSPDPTQQYRLIIPAHMGQVSYRTLLGCLVSLDLNATAVKLEPEPGRDEKVTIFKVFLDPTGLQQVRGEWIGDQAVDLQIAVDSCRRSLGLPPQFPDEWATPQSPTPSPQTSYSDC